MRHNCRAKHMPVAISWVRCKRMWLLLTNKAFDINGTLNHFYYLINYLVHAPDLKITLVHLFKISTVSCFWKVQKVYALMDISIDGEMVLKVEGPNSQFPMFRASTGDANRNCCCFNTNVLSKSIDLLNTMGT